MPIAIIDGNRRELEKIVDEGNQKFTDALASLGASLGAYGFEGTIEVQFTITVDDKALGGVEAKLGRSFSSRFKRPL